MQRNRILSRLTNDNHVLVFDPKEFNKSLGYLIAKLKGEEINHQCKFDFLNEVSIKKATTFEGFCNKHDTELFLPIEKYNYDRKDRKQNFLFAYRIVNQEYCDKQMLLNLFQNIFRERPILSTDFIFVENYRMRMLEVQDIEKLKRIFDNALIQNNYDLIKTHTIELKEEYKFAIATSYIPRKDIFGRQEIIDIYSKEEKRLPNIFLTIFPEENKTNIIFNWLKVDKKKLRILTNQLRTEDEKNIKKYLNNIIPRYSEKYVFSKKMWAKYNDDEKESFKRNFLSLDFKIFGLEYKDFLEESKFDFFKYK